MQKMNATGSFQKLTKENMPEELEHVLVKLDREIEICCVAYREGDDWFVPPSGEKLNSGVLEFAEFLYEEYECEICAVNRVGQIISIKNDDDFSLCRDALEVLYKHRSKFIKIMVKHPIEISFGTYRFVFSSAKEFDELSKTIDQKLSEYDVTYNKHHGFSLY